MAVEGDGRFYSGLSPRSWTIRCQRGISDSSLARSVSGGLRIIVKPADDTFWGGYAGYFQDPDGHLWEVAWNPQWVVKD